MVSALRIIVLLSILITWAGEAAAQRTITGVTLVNGALKQYGKIEFDIAVSGAYTNPYSDDDIAVDLNFTSPSGKQLTLPVYFVSGNGTTSQWKARFTPVEAGTYQYTAKVFKNTTTENQTSSAQFQVSASVGDGFLLMGNKHWHLTYSSGKPFRGIGENIAWENRVWEDPLHTYDYLLNKVSTYGSNFYRTWMCAWNLPLEWKKIVDTQRYSDNSAHYHPQGIQRMDELVEMSESLGMHMMVALDWHGALQTGDRWNIHNYNTSNGGPASTPTEFFTSTTAKRRYKNRLRYIVARWGYSPSIGAWEFFNEIDNAAYNGTESSVAIPLNTIAQWHDEMATYLKSIDPYDHPVTTSVSHRELTGLFSVPDIDIVQTHIYRNTGSLPARIKEIATRYNKPYVVGEFGYDWDWNNINNSIGAELDFDFKRGLWYGLFSPTPILPMSWWWEFFDKRNTDKYFQPVRTIADQMLLAGKGNHTEISMTSPATGVETYAVKCGEHYFVYALNNNAVSIATQNISVPITETGSFAIRRFDPERNQFKSLTARTPSSGRIAIEQAFAAQQSLVFILSPEGNTTGVLTPFQGTRTALPGIIKIEEYDLGGEHIAYRDYDAANTGNAIRGSEGVDIQQASIAGHYNITDIVDGEWIKYSVEFKKSGIYAIKAKVASASSGKSFKLLIDGKSFTETFNVPNTGGLQTWADVTKTSSVITKGNREIMLQFQSSGFNLSNIEFELLAEGPDVTILSPTDGALYESNEDIEVEIAASDADGTVAKVQLYANDELLEEFDAAPYTTAITLPIGEYTIRAVATDNDGHQVESVPSYISIRPSQLQKPFPDPEQPHIIPGKIEAEDFDSGESTVAYLDNTPGNIKGFYRTNTDVDIEECSDAGNGFNLADIQSGEWVEYTVDVSKTSNYNVRFRVATQMPAQSFYLMFNDNVVVNNINVPNTGGWQTWADVEVKGVYLTQGVGVLRLVFNSEYFNLNYFTFEDVGLTTSLEAETTSLAFIAPNPTVGNITVHLSKDASRAFVFNAQGRRISNYENIKRGELVTPAVAPGFYTVMIEYASGKIEFLKAIVK